MPEHRRSDDAATGSAVKAEPEKATASRPGPQHPKQPPRDKPSALKLNS
jgi:hypothetical protein